MQVKLDLTIIGAFLPLSAHCTERNRKLQLVIEFNYFIKSIICVERSPSCKHDFVVVVIEMNEVAQLIDFVFKKDSVYGDAVVDLALLSQSHFFAKVAWRILRVVTSCARLPLDHI